METRRTFVWTVVIFVLVVAFFMAGVVALKWDSDSQDKACLLEGGVYLEAKNRAVCIDGDAVLEK